MSLAFSRHFLASQFGSLPELTYSFSGQTVIVTGSNTGLGFEAAKHYHNLGASLVILAVRDPKKGDVAKGKIQRPNGGEIRVMQLDMSDAASVTTFTKDAAKLPRIDVFLANAGMTQPNWQLSKDGIEMTLSVNFYATMLLVLLMVPIMKNSGEKDKTESKLTVVTSEAHHLTSWGQKAEALSDLHDESKFDSPDRYNITKLLQVLYIRELAQRIDPNDGVIINLVNPGMNKSEFDRNLSWTARTMLWLIQALIAREPEIGAKTMVWPTTIGAEGHGQYSLDCTFNERAMSRFVRSAEGVEAQKRIFQETNVKLENIQPGILTATWLERES